MVEKVKKTELAPREFKKQKFHGLSLPKITQTIRVLAVICAIAIVANTIWMIANGQVPSDNIGFYIGERAFFNLLPLFFTFTLTFLPNVLNNLKIYLPPSFMLIIIVFTTAACFLGDFLGFYTRFAWWDDMLHTISGLVLALIGFMLVYILNTIENKKTFHLSPLIVALFTFTFAVASAVIWEIFEFCSDWWLGTNLQHYADQWSQPLFLGRYDQGPGLIDTMSDLIENVLGALAVAIAGYFYLKKRAAGQRQPTSNVVVQGKKQARKFVNWLDDFFEHLIDFVTHPPKKSP